MQGMTHEDMPSGGSIETLELLSRGLPLRKGYAAGRVVLCLVDYYNATGASMRREYVTWWARENDGARFDGRYFPATPAGMISAIENYNARD